MSTKKYTCTLQAAFLRILTAEPGCLNQAGYSPFILFYPMFIMPAGLFLSRRGYTQWQRFIPGITVDSTIIEFSCSGLAVLVLSRLQHTKGTISLLYRRPVGAGAELHHFQYTRSHW